MIIILLNNGFPFGKVDFINDQKNMYFIPFYLWIIQLSTCRVCVISFQNISNWKNFAKNPTTIFQLKIYRDHQ